MFPEELRFSRSEEGLGAAVRSKKGPTLLQSASRVARGEETPPLKRTAGEAGCSGVSQVCHQWTPLQPTSLF